MNFLVNFKCAAPRGFLFINSEMFRQHSVGILLIKFYIVSRFIEAGMSSFPVYTIETLKKISKT